jgi:enamine deaminase RidA (YjgF/YER057c/UK114 family)
MKDVSCFKEMNQVYREYFPEGEEPARVAIQALSPLPSIDIEIEAVAINRRAPDQPMLALVKHQLPKRAL